ncbi:MAG: nucleotide exchange factor GrpE [Pseudomonadota bacterium]
MAEKNESESVAESAAEGAEAAKAAEAVEAAGEAAGAEPAMEGPSVEDLIPGLDDAIEAETAERLLALEEERDALKDKLLRALAETENVRRRAERDRKDAEAYGGTRLARDLLAVHDNLERALASADDGLRADHEAFFEGLELTRRELLNAFAKHKIEVQVPEKGDRFDPNLHQAMFEAPVPGTASGTVIEVMQAGFTISGRLLRPALVGVSKGGPAGGPNATDTPATDSAD